MPGIVLLIDVKFPTCHSNFGFIQSVALKLCSLLNLPCGTETDFGLLPFHVVMTF
jgi:hypothetical protein